MSAISKILSLQDTPEEMRAAIADPNVALSYTPYDRAYTIMFVDPGMTPRESLGERGGISLGFGWCIYVCPWSGKRLPKILFDEWEAIVEAQYGAELGRAYDAIPSLPASILSEQWWMESTIEDWPEIIRYWFDRRNDSNRQTESEEEMPLPYRYEPYLDPERPGISRFRERPPHLCWNLEERLHGPRTMYAYLPYTREYGIRILDLDTVIDHQPLRILPVPYCPWCGAEHPKPLRQEWEAHLSALGLSPDSPDIAVDLRSDTWWREAGL